MGEAVTSLSSEKRGTAQDIWARLAGLRHRKPVQNAVTFSLVVLGPLLAVATFAVLGPIDRQSGGAALRAVLFADVVYILVVATLVMGRVVRMVAARRAHSAGSRLHLRLTGAFAFMALLPTVTVAIFAFLTINLGLETWFSERVRQVVGASLAAAQAYESEAREALTSDATRLATALDAGRRGFFGLADGDLRVILGQAQAQVPSDLIEAYVIDGAANIRARGDRSYLFGYEAPLLEDFNAARRAGIALISDWRGGEYRALLPLDNYTDRFLYVTRAVDGDLLQLLDQTQETARFYQQQEAERGRHLFDFALLYLAFALLLILAAIWLGLWFAERLSRPVGQLTGAAQRVGEGDLDVRVIEESGDDEIAELGKYFNQMTRQLKAQRETLLDNTRQIERRRRLFDSVLSSISSGVVGLDPEGRITFVNRSAEKLLDWHEDQQAVPIEVAVPEFGPLLSRLRTDGAASLQEELRMSRNGRIENLLVRMSPRSRESGELEGFVIAFDDVTDLVAAQRSAAWGDVARRIAHEIKNPLTPIQLSAERIKRKFSRLLEESDAGQLAQMTEVIVRQTNDLRRIVDEFSRFARMPEPERKPEDLVALVQGAVTLQRAGQPSVRFETALPDAPMMVDLDATMIGQALTNLLKNGGEAIETYQEKNPDVEIEGTLRIALSRRDDQALLTIADNGIGLPEDRSRLFEPYVTTREKGTGLGLPIVKKIIEEHGGTLQLEDAPAFGESGRAGAQAVICLPLKLENQET